MLPHADVTFYTDEQLLARGLSDRQIQAVRYVREQGVITNKTYRQLTGVIDRAALRDLIDLCMSGIFLKRGTKGKAIEYILVKRNPDTSGIIPLLTTNTSTHCLQTGPYDPGAEAGSDDW